MRAAKNIGFYGGTATRRPLGVDEDGHDWFRCSKPGCRKCPVVRLLHTPLQRALPSAPRAPRRTSA